MPNLDGMGGVWQKIGTSRLIYPTAKQEWQNRGASLKLVGPFVVSGAECSVAVRTMVWEGDGSNPASSSIMLSHKSLNCNVICDTMAAWQQQIRHLTGWEITPETGALTTCWPLLNVTELKYVTTAEVTMFFRNYTGLPSDVKYLHRVEKLCGWKRCGYVVFTLGMKGFPAIAAFRSWKIDRPCLRTVDI